VFLEFLWAVHTFYVTYTCYLYHKPYLSVFACFYWNCWACNIFNIINPDLQNFIDILLSATQPITYIHISIYVIIQDCYSVYLSVLCFFGTAGRVQLFLCILCVPLNKSVDPQQIHSNIQTLYHTYSCFLGVVTFFPSFLELDRQKNKK
jgi:hypothetical protein